MNKKTIQIFCIILLVIILIVGYIYISKNNYEKADLSETRNTTEESLTWKEITTTAPKVDVQEDMTDESGWGPMHLYD